MKSERTEFDARLDTVPDRPGVYLMKDASGAVIYVGKAKNLKNRLRSYFSKNPSGNGKVLAMISHIADFDYVVVNTELEALLLESNFIKRHQPHYNILLRDDKGFPYVCVTMNEQYPRIMKAFRIGKDREQGARYYGPFLGGDLYHALRGIRDIFPTKTCRRVLPRDIGKQRPCLNYHIGQCIGPCRGDVSAGEYRAVMEDVCRFFEGRYDGIKKDLSEKMQQASDEMKFERAAIYRDRLAALTRIVEAQNVSFPNEKDVDAIGLFRDAGEICIRKLELRGGLVVGSSTFFVPDDGEDDAAVLSAFLIQYYPDASTVPPLVLLPVLPEDAGVAEEYLTKQAGRKVELRVPMRGDGVRLLELSVGNARESLRRRILRVGESESGIREALEQLRARLNMSRIPGRIEAFDISNLGQDDRCGAMAVFKDGRPNRTGYRFFKIKAGEGQDDYGSMREVLRRRFSHTENDFGTLPDLVLMDGGKAHVLLARTVLEEFGLNERVVVAGMVKDRKHKTAGLVLPDGTTELFPEAEQMTEEHLVLLRLLTAVQNEVHRLAFSYQRKLSKKRNLSFVLEDIDGIGPAKRKALLQHFGTIGRIRAADEQTLAQAPKITAGNAKSIYRHFHRREEK
ncbi:MAG: excinuclease ABC subunit UvrC [Oscillospiraceae bacterium]|nr:excinuclease ABC subunit UvrC [Oscillospiraceae bacterium]